MEQLLKYFTFLTENQINQEMIKHNEEPEKRHAQNTLAEQVTLLVHGGKLQKYLFQNNLFR